MNYTLTKQKTKPNAISFGAATETQIFHACCWLFLVAFFILPDGFGFDLILLFSAKRIMTLVCLAMIIFNRERFTLFLNDVKTYVGPNILIGAYEFVRLYTSIYRIEITTIGYSILDEIAAFYLFAYIFMHEISLEQFLRFIRITLIILCAEGFWEAAMGINLFGFLNLAGAEGWGTYATRAAGLSRVSGNCHHSIHFGIYLSILFYLSCIDVKRNRLYLFRNPLLFVLTTVCIFLTGSRAPLGIYLLGLILICFFSKKDECVKSFLILGGIASLFSLFLMIVYRTEIGHQVMFMLTNMWDAVFGTTYAEAWGGTLTGSNEYRDALVKVFQLDYFNKLVGRGNKSNLSVVIDGYWLRSCDNSYILTYISLAYPGLIMMILHGIAILYYSIRGFFEKKQYLFGAIITIVICYYINIWYVAPMGTYIYMWMLFAMAYITFKRITKE